MIKYLVAIIAVIGVGVGVWALGSGPQDGDDAAVTAPETVLADTGAQIQVTVYKSASCGCCIKWNDHLSDAGYQVTAHDTAALYAYKVSVGVPDHLQSCHTATIGGYVIEGHVPVREIERLLREKPDAIGLTVPGMVSGSPGMENGYSDPYDVLLFDKNGNTSIYASY